MRHAYWTEQHKRPEISPLNKELTNVYGKAFNLTCMCKLILEVKVMRKINSFLSLTVQHAHSSLRKRTLHRVCTMYVCSLSVLYILIKHSDYFPLQHSPCGLSPGNELCSWWGPK
jgi:hypothetical protein